MGKNNLIIEIVTMSGAELASNLYESQCYIKINSEDKKVTFENCGFSAAGEIMPIGLFETLLPEPVFTDIQKVFKKIKLEKIEFDEHDGVGHRKFIIKLTQNNKIIERKIGDQDLAGFPWLQEFLDKVDKLSFRVLSHPIAAIKLEIATDYSEPIVFDYKLTNIGKQDVCIPSFAEADNKPELLVTAGVRIENIGSEMSIADSESTSSMNWDFVFLNQDNAVSPPLCEYSILTPGRSYVSKSKQWLKNDGQTTYAAQGVYQNLRGPKWIDKRYHVRGSLLSKKLQIHPV